MATVASSFRAIAMICASAVFAGCSAGSFGIAPNAPIQRDSLRGSATNFTIRIAVPSSAVAKSVVIKVTPSTGSQAATFDENLISPSLMVAFTGAPGRYSAIFETFSGKLNGKGYPTGKKLSAHQNVSFIISGAKGLLAVSIESPLARLSFTPGSSAMNGSMPSGYVIPKCFPSSQPVDVLGLDAQQNVLLGKDAPVPSLVSNRPPILSVSNALRSATNEFKVSPTISSAERVAILTAKERSSAGVTVRASVKVTIESASSICGIFTAFFPPTASSQPNGITVGPDGAIWFTEDNFYTSPAIGRITTAGVITQYPAGSAQYGIAAGPDGALWFTEDPGDKIGRMTTGGVFTEYPVPSGASQPLGIVGGPDGALWFTEQNTNKVGRITTAGAATEFTVTTPNDIGPRGITVGPDNALWFTEYGACKIGRITTAGTINEYPLSFNAGPEGIVAGPDGALWFAEQESNKIGRITTSGAITEYPLPSSNTASLSGGITIGPDGALWFTQIGEIGRITMAGQITELALPKSFQRGVGITLGPDGALWITNTINAVGRLQ